MADPDPQAYFATPSAITAGGRYAQTLEAVPGDLAALAAVAQGLVLHEHFAPFYGVTPTEEARASVHVRPVEELIALALALDDRPLHQARPPDRRVLGNCRHFTVLFVALLRARGIPARARCGFGGYFIDGRYEDHWVAEVWDAEVDRWHLVDAQLDEPQRDALGIDFDVLDVPRDRFLIAGDAWTRCRSGERDPDTFGLTMLSEAGEWWIVGNLLRDVAALGKVELLPWDVWGAMTEPDVPIDPENRPLFDRLASMTQDPDAALAGLHELASTDERLRVPRSVLNATRGTDEVVPT